MGGFTPSLVPPVPRPIQKMFRAIRGRWREWPIEVLPNTPPDPPELEVKDEKQTEVRVLECRHPETPSYALFSAGLPVEIWLLILKHALEPRFGVMQEFLPENIHFFYTSLIIHAFSCPDRTEFKRTKASLLLVCKFIHSEVKRICSIQQETPSWIWSFSADNARRYGPCTRLDTRFKSFDDISALTEQYRYEVGTASIHVQYATPSLQSPSLSSLLSYPWTLKVLHITTPGSPDNVEEVPFSILTGLSSLQTLSIAAPGPLRLSGELCMPELTALFLTCTLGMNSDISKWTLTKLKKLAIDSRGWPCRGKADDLNGTYTDFIQRHRDTLIALRLIPLAKPPFTPFSRLKPLSHLEVLATDFVRYPPELALTAQHTVLHLTHISTHAYTVNQLSSTILQTLKVFSSAQSLAITEDPFLGRESSQDVDGKENQISDREELEELEELCLLRNIRITGKVGSHLCCFSKACNLLTAPDM
ncbi:hypothetical protein M408DRAFT_152221 [Serendipita vermifera MAFF 305830]|uniref:Uncharacterized protein n=1 Tax=Serendipita vermifera MAFF 305830 TaxID=933852 RepID=A0A0C2X589_SERVB|nr:hypothetical protein M408DRAFT_152221 [Serendipita vermifera MAFF 305830]